MVHEPNAKLASALLLAFVGLLPFEPIYNVPLIALGGLGLLRLACRRARLGSPENRFLCIAFLCIWLPMLASLPDAASPAESIRKTASTCIYFLAGVYVTGAYRCFRDLDRIMWGVAAICLFWCLDALWQLHTGAERFEVLPWEKERLTGLFHVVGRIGYVLVSFAPLVFEAVRRASGRWPWSPILLAPFVLVILLSGSRASWLALAVAAVGYVLYLVRRAHRPRWNPKRIVGVCVAAGLALGIGVFAKPDGAGRAWKAVEPRMEVLTGLWSEDPEKRVLALSYRPVIWETAVNMFRAHWLNGVGPRGFRHAYPEYKPARDRYFRSVASPHSPVLEIATDTGVLGLLGYVVLAAALLARLRRLEPGPFESACPYVLLPIVALFPFNGHLSFHGVLSTGLIWWTIFMSASAFALASSGKRPATAGA